MIVAAFNGSAYASVSGSYYVEETFFSGQLKVVERGGRIKFSLHTVTKLSSQIHVGEVEGTVPLANHVAVFRGEQGCVLKIIFAGSRAIVGGGSTCRYYIGSNGNFDGIYYRKKAKR
jgi:hypothetical protein